MDHWDCDRLKMYSSCSVAEIIGLGAFPHLHLPIGRGAGGEGEKQCRRQSFAMFVAENVHFIRDERFPCKWYTIFTFRHQV